MHTALHLPLLLVALGAAALWAAQLRSLLRWVARQPGGRARLALVGAVLGASLVAEVAWVPVQEQQLSTAGGATLGAAERYGVARLAVHAADAALLAYLLMPTPGKAIVKFGRCPTGAARRSSEYGDTGGMGWVGQGVWVQEGATCVLAGLAGGPTMQAVLSSETKRTSESRTLCGA